MRSRIYNIKVISLFCEYDILIHFDYSAYYSAELIP